MARLTTKEAPPLADEYQEFEPQVAALPEIEGAGQPFFEYLSGISPADWEAYLLYAYRLQPITDLSRAGQQRHYIARFAHAINEEDLKQEFGSGQYELLLNKLVGATRKSKCVRRVICDILDQRFPPKVPAGAWLDDERNRRWQWAKDMLEEAAKPKPEPAPTGAMGGMDPAAFFKAIREIIKEVRPDVGGSAQEALTKEVINAMAAANKESISLVRSQVGQQDPAALVNLVKELAAAIQPPPSKDTGLGLVREIAGLMREMNPKTEPVQPAPPRDIAAEMTSFAQAAAAIYPPSSRDSSASMIREFGTLLSAMRELNPPPAQQNPLGDLQRFAETVTAVKEAFGGEGGGGNPGPTGWAGIARELGPLIPATLRELSGVLGNVGNLITRRPMMMPQGPPPAITGPQPQPQPGEGGQEGTPMGSPGMQQAVLNQIGGPLLNFLNGGRSGTDFADYLVEGYGQIAFNSIRGMGKENITTMLRESSLWTTLAPMEGRLAEFIEEFMGWEPEQPGQQEAEPVEAAPASGAKKGKGKG